VGVDFFFDMIIRGADIKNKIVDMYYLKGLGLKEVADHFGVSPNNAYSMLRKGREMRLDGLTQEEYVQLLKKRVERRNASFSDLLKLRERSPYPNGSYVLKVRRSPPCFSTTMWDEEVFDMLIEMAIDFLTPAQRRVMVPLFYETPISEIEDKYKKANVSRNYARANSRLLNFLLGRDTVIFGRTDVGVGYRAVSSEIDSLSLYSLLEEISVELSPKDRETMIYVYFKGYSQNKFAYEAGRSESAVQRSLSRVNIFIKKSLKRLVYPL